MKIGSGILPCILIPVLVACCDSKDEITSTTTQASVRSAEDCQQIAIGMTLGQVKAILGEPQVRATKNGVPAGWGWYILDEETTFDEIFHHHFKAVFKDGKVSEVEFSSGNTIHFTFDPQDGS